MSFWLVQNLKNMGLNEREVFLLIEAFCKYGDCSSIGRALVCGTRGWGFKSPQSPPGILLGEREVPYGRRQPRLILNSGRKV